MIARLADAVDRRRATRARTLVAALDARFDPAVAMELKELLTDRLASEPELVGQLCNRRGSAKLQRGENGSTAIGKLFDGENGATSAK